MKKLTIRWLDAGFEFDYHDSDPPIIADLTTDELLDRVRSAEADGYKVYVVVPFD